MPLYNSGLMTNPERKIFIPLGDKYRSDLEEAAFDEAWRISHEIMEEEYSKGKITASGRVPLKILDSFDPTHCRQKGIIAMGGYFVTIEERKMPRKDFRKGKISP